MDKEFSSQEAVSVASRISQVRKAAKLSQSAFAEMLGSSLSTISRVEKGHRQPDADLLIAISRNFDVDLNWVLTGIGATRHKGVSAELQQGVPIPLIRKLSKRLMDSPAEDVDGLLNLPDFPPGAVACRCADDGCAPRISVADIVVFTPGFCAVGDWVVICDEWGRGYVRQKQEMGGQGIYIADQPDYPRLVDADVACLGKVCGVIRKFA